MEKTQSQPQKKINQKRSKIINHVDILAIIKKSKADSKKFIQRSLSEMKKEKSTNQIHSNSETKLFENTRYSI